VTGKRQVRVQKQAVEGNDPHGGHKPVFEGDRTRQGEPWNYPEESIHIQNMAKI